MKNVMKNVKLNKNLLHFFISFGMYFLAKYIRNPYRVKQ